MSGDPYDAQGEVRDALNTAVESYGRRVLDDPRVLGNLVTDLLPDLPRERSLLVAAAEAGVGAELSQHVDGQHMDADTAVALAAQSLSQNRSLDQAASTWVTTEYAKALGYQVRYQAPLPPVDSGSVEPPPFTPPRPPHDETQTTGQPPYTWPPAGTPMPPPPPPPPTQPEPRPTSPVPQNPWPPAPAPVKSRRGLLLGGGGVAAVIVLYLIVAAVAQAFPFSKSKPAPIPTPKPVVTVTTPHPHTSSPAPATTSPAPATSTPPALAAGVKRLKVLLPTDIMDASTECTPATGIKWKDTGLVTADSCDPPDLGTGGVLGYQFDSEADYLAGWDNFNTWLPFGVSKSSDVPPPSGQSQGGPEEWWNNANGFPAMAGQVIECYTDTSGDLVYVWTYPTDDTFIVAVAPKGWTWTKLDNWWTDNSV